MARRPACLNAISELSTEWIGAVGQGHGDVDHGETERPAHEIFLHAGLDGRDVLFRHDAAGDGVGEGEPAAARQGLDIQHHVAELAMAAGLPLEPPSLGRRLSDRFLVGNARPIGGNPEAVFVLQLVDRDPEMHLALAPEDELMGIGVLLIGNRGILVANLGERGGELDLVAAIGGIDRQAVDGR